MTDYQSKHRFSLRKYSIGLASVLLGMALLANPLIAKADDAQIASVAESTISLLSLDSVLENSSANPETELDTETSLGTEVAEDRQAPQLISITTNKTDYQAGETVLVRVEARDESSLSSAYVSFRNESNTHSLGNGIYDSSQFHQLPNGHYVVEIPINIP
ncbi:YSIRK-type signal peptide-containing protein, partial [Streptococcus entericus]